MLDSVDILTLKVLWNHIQGSHRLEKYLNIQDCLEKSLKIKFAMKSTWKTLKGLEKALNFTIYRRTQHCFWRPKPQFYTNLLKLISKVMHCRILEVEFLQFDSKTSLYHPL